MRNFLDEEVGEVCRSGDGTDSALGASCSVLLLYCSIVRAGVLSRCLCVRALSLSLSLSLSADHPRRARVRCCDYIVVSH